MAYDPRNTALADGLFTQRFGKTVLVVADDEARDALDPAVTPVAITASDDLLNIYDADASAWTKIGKDTIVTVPTVAALDDVANPEEIELAIVDATSEIYRYNGTAWVLCAGGGGGTGSGVQTVATVADLLGIADPEDNPVALVLSENAFYSYIDGSWNKVQGAETTKEVAGGGSWNLVKKIMLKNEVMDETLALADGQYRIAAVITSAIQGYDCGFKFSDTNLWQQMLYSQGDLVTPSSPIVSFCPYAFDNAVGYTTEAMLTVKNGDIAGVVTYTRLNYIPATSVLGATNYFAGNGVGNTMRLLSSVTFSGEISISKWEDIKATELHTYELVKELIFDNEIVNANVPWNADDDRIRIVIEKEYVDEPLKMRINGDSGSNYTRVIHYGGSAHGTSVNSENYLNICTGYAEYSEFYGILRVGGIRAFNVDSARLDISARAFRYTDSLFWSNVVDPVHSLQFFTAVPITGRIRIYKLAKTHLLDTAVNKVANEAALLSIPVWDGKLAMTLDEKQLFVYDAGKQTWLGKSGVKMTPGTFEARELAGVYTEADLNAGDIEIDVKGVDSLFIEGNYETDVNGPTVSVFDDATTTYARSYIACNPKPVGAAANTPSGILAWGKTRSTTVLYFSDNGTYGVTDASYHAEGYLLTSHFRSNQKARASKVTITSSGTYIAGTLIRVYKSKNIVIPDFASAEANLYGWKLLGAGSVVSVAPQVIRVDGKYEKMKFVAKAGAAGALAGTGLRVNNIASAQYQHSYIYNTTSSSVDTTLRAEQSFRGVLGTWDGHDHNAYDIEIVANKVAETVFMLGNGTSLLSENAYSNTISVSGFVAGVTVIDSVEVVNDNGDAAVEWELYGWGKIEVPVLAGSTLPYSTITADATLATAMYAMVDTSGGAIELTMPGSPTVGDELVILDAMRTFGQDGHECTLVSLNEMIEGSSASVNLDVEGKEYKFRFVGGSMGWRML